MTRVHKYLLLFMMSAAALSAMQPSQAFAQACEPASVATTQMNGLARDIRSELNKAIRQERNFIDERFHRTAKNEILNRLEELDVNFRNGLAYWWRGELLPAMRRQSAQLSVAQVAKTEATGRLINAQLEVEQQVRMESEDMKSYRKHQPNEMSCQVDTVAVGQTRIVNKSAALARALVKDSEPERKNARGTAAAQGPAAQQKVLWEEYTTYFCNAATGDQGCTATGSLAGQHTDLGRLLWGDKQTLDMSNADTRRVVDAVQRNLIKPRASETILPAVLDAPQGKETMLARRSRHARENAVYNVISRMIADRETGSRVNTQSMRTAAGLPPGDASTDASYREIMEAMTRDRYGNPEYVTRLVQSPEQLLQELGSINVMKLQQFNDLYKRVEEMIFMEVAFAAAEVDGRMPDTADSATPTRR